jgi:hypothetical protein
MKSLGNNKKGTLTDFIRYIRGEMTKREENNFQRYLQKDPFAEEAGEGFSQLSPDELENDLDILGKKIKKRTERKQKYIYYRIAASIAVLMIISSVFIISTRNRTERELSKSAVSETPMEIPVSTGIEEKSEDKEAKAVMPDRDIEESTEEYAEEVKPERKEKAVTGGIADRSGNEAGDKADEQAMDMAEIQPEVFEAPAAQKKAATTQVSGIIAPDSTEHTVYNPPSPQNGQENFDRYIEENIQIPDSIPEGQRVVVVLNLLVKSTGVIDTILVTSSPGDEFSEEAIRLIKEGPEWKPAIENGRTINDEVKIKIVFLKNNDDEHLPE